jgi:acylphosphatase
LLFEQHAAMEESRAAKRYFVSGMVQGVGYRYFARQLAQRLAIAGYVKNLRDGRVEVYAIAAPSALAALREELARGPAGAMVSSVVEDDAPIDAHFAARFSVERDN